MNFINQNHEFISLLLRQINDNLWVVLNPLIDNLNRHDHGTQSKILELGM